MQEKMMFSLKEVRDKRKLTEADLYIWIESGKIPLYFKVPKDKIAFVASKTFLDILIDGASPSKIQAYRRMGGIEESESAPGIVWLRLPFSKYKTLFASGICRLHYFPDGLQPSEQGLILAKPLFRREYSFSHRPLSLDMAYCLTNTSTSVPPVQDITLDEVFILARHVTTAKPSPRKTGLSRLPTYYYASNKLEIALEVWKEIWGRDFEKINDKNRTPKTSIKAKHNEAVTLTKRKLEELFKSNDYSGEKYKDLYLAIAKLIHPTAAQDDDDRWFTGSISDGIEAMIAASNHFWAKVDDKQYGHPFSRACQKFCV